MKNVLLLAHDDAGQEARLQAALDVTRAISGHLSCLDVITPPLAPGYGIYGDYNGAATAELLENERQRAVLNRARIEKRLSHEEVSWDWKNVIGVPDEEVRDAAKLADLVVLSMGLDAHEPSELRHLCGRMAAKAHRAVLAVPTQACGINLSGTALVAWDGSHEADEALRDAIPLLQQADHVVLLDLDDPEAPFSTVDAATYLSRYGVHPRVHAMYRKENETVFGAILEKARNIAAAYIVMGAFGHSPTIETIFGGVTRSMLANSEIPLVLAH